MLQEEMHSPQNGTEGESSYETEEPRKVEKSSFSFYLSFHIRPCVFSV